MKSREIWLGAVAVAFAVILPSCAIGGSGSTGSLTNGPTLSVTPTVTMLAENAVVNFTSATDAPTPPIWTLANSQFANVGTLSYPNGAGTAQYTAPPTPPIYTGAPSSDQGVVTLYVNARTAAGGDSLVTERIAVLAPVVTTGISPGNQTLPRGGVLYFSGYAVGAASNAVTWSVNGTAGGNATIGTITALGVYTAPPALPMSGAAVTVTVTSVADPTKSSSSVITLL